MHKLSLLAGFGAGYVLGARAGRARYEELMDRFQTLKASPVVQDAASKVQEKASDVTEVAKTKVISKASEVKDKAKATNDASASAGEDESADALVGGGSSDKAQGNQSTASGAPSSGAAPGGLDPLAGPKGELP